jgi:hypothetical protein
MPSEPRQATDYTLASGNNPGVVELVSVVNDNDAADGHFEQYGYKGSDSVTARQCCGCCCDMRRAVIVVNIVNACLIICGLLSVAALAGGSSSTSAATSAFTNDQAAANDDQMESVVEEVFTSMKGSSLGFLTTIMAVKLILSLIGIYGAMTYNVLMVCACYLSYILEALVALLTPNVLGLLYYGFFAYPHVSFILEVRDGVMTKENYSRVKHSCCCV